jgi:hypothetical protein
MAVTLSCCTSYSGASPFGWSLSFTQTRVVATNFKLLIFDPLSGAVTCERWLGQSGTLEVARQVLSRSPASIRSGLECWSDVRPEEVRGIAEASYVGGATPAETLVLADRFPVPRYVWMLIRDF